jgi:tRNA uridine 5-carbamoylmethylation protein Kti12
VNAPFLLILTGPPGAGKTTLASLVAEHFTPSVVIEADALWARVVRGFIEPWDEGADHQNAALVRASLAAAARLASAGYATVLSGHVGPRYLGLVRDELSHLSVPVAYVVLRPHLDVCLANCVKRTGTPQHAGALSDETVIRGLYESYCDLGDIERHVFDASGLTVDESVSRLVSELGSARFMIQQPNQEI